MKKNIQLFNLFVIFITMNHSIFIFSQARPYNPPDTPILNLDNFNEINFEILNQFEQNIDLTHFNREKIDGFHFYQFNIKTELTQEITIEIQNAMNSENDFYYIRYLNGGYIGPFNFNELKANNILIINGIKPSEFIVEYCTPIDHLTIGPIITSIHENEYSYAKAKHQRFNYWKRNREDPKVLVTGFWPPTNEMIRHFSTNLELNPSGWVGEDWEERGYDIVSYFPEFEEPNCNDCGMGYGDLEVDYQDTSIDFWNIVNDIQPIAIVTFSRGFIDHSWELEFNFYNRTNWYADYLAPLLPTPNPPDEGVENYFERNSTLPMDEIEDAVEEAGLGLNAYIDWQGDPGHFVSEFMGYHGVWYRDINQQSENICHIAGHVHVGGLVDWDIAREATHITIRKVLDQLDQFDYILGDVNEDTFINIQDLLMVVQFILGNQEPMIGESFAADMNIDSTINIQDVIILINIILGN